MSRVLHFDSDDRRLKERSRLLCERDFEVVDTRAASSLPALVIAERPDVVLLGDGHEQHSVAELCRQLHQQAGGVAFSVLVVADACATPAGRASLLDAGAEACLAPSPDAAELVATVAALARRQLVRTRELDMLRQIAAHRDRLLADLQRATALLDLMFEDAPIGFGVWDRDLRFVRLNAKLAAITGLPVGELVGRTIAEVLPDMDPRATAMLRRVIDAGESIVGVEVSGQTPAAPGEPHHWAISGYPVRLDGEIVGVGAICEDITRAKAAAAERERLLASERAARAEAEGANRLKDEFLATLSHELRTPLNAIMGWTHMLRAGALSPETAARAHEAIARCAQAQAQIVGDLLDVSRVITGKLRLELQPVQLEAIVEAVLESVKPAVQSRHLRLDTRIPAGLPAIMGDPARLQQVIWNLLSNAIKFTDPGGHVTLSVQAEEGVVRMTVRDTGQGIPAEFLPCVFDRFSQADGSTTRRVGGLGLGLSIVRHLVELHGGTVHAESQGPGQGAIFTVCLPIGFPPAAADPARVAGDPGSRELAVGSR